MSVIVIESDEHFEGLIDKHRGDTLAMNFWADFAPPSIQMNTVFAELAAKYPTTKFLQIDAEKLEDISETFDVEAVPYFVIMRGTEVLSKISGANPKELQAALDRHTTTGAYKIPPPLKPQEPVSRPVEQARVAEEDLDLNARLEQLVNAAPVMLFMKGSPSAPQCGFSRTLVGLLRDENIKYGFFNILADDEVRQGLKTFSEWPTFPQLYVKGEFVGGLDVVREMIENGEMGTTLDEAGISHGKN